MMFIIICHFTIFNQNVDLEKVCAGMSTPCYLLMWHAQDVWGRRSLVNLLRGRKRVVPFKPVTSCSDVYRLTNSSRFWILSQRQTQQQQEERPFSQVSGNTGNKHMGCWETASYGNSEVRIYRLLIVHAGYFQCICCTGQKEDELFWYKDLNNTSN